MLDGLPLQRMILRMMGSVVDTGATSAGKAQYWSLAI